MNRLLVPGDRAVALGPWWMAVTKAGAAARPGELRLPAGIAADGPPAAAPTLDWIPAVVPGTAAAALEAAGRWSREDPLSLHDRDVWYVTRLPETGRRTLRLSGLATVAEAWVGDERVLTAENMFRSHEVELDAPPDAVLALAFRALRPALERKAPRARWRVPMIPAQGLRQVRTTLFGHMPGWCPPIDVVGPTDEVSLVERGAVRVTDPRLRARHEGATGVLDVSVAAEGVDAAVLVCGEHRAPMTRDRDRLAGRLVIAEVRPWWPNGYGEAALYPVSIEVDGGVVDLGRVGFRTVEADPDAAGFALKINGVPVFCRGAVWTTADIVALPRTREAYEPILRLAAEAGMTMIRVGGTMIPESRAFFDLCDELGLMVWQEFPFANFDYPAGDDGFAAECGRESADLLAEIGAAPSLAVLCGGSEMIQQAAMMGLPPERWPGPLVDDILARAAAEARPDVPYVPNSPSGGPLPFVPNRGVAHYYGVGAYQRPLDDARRAEVTFAAECLAFANVPDARTLAEHLPVPAVHDPRWKARVPRDLNASWDFEDVRDHYLAELFAVEPARLRREEPALYLDLSRVVTGAVMEAVFAEWRRGRSPTRGGLVWTLMDLMPGAGWGVIDATGLPKAAWYALKRAFRPAQVTLTDEGTNGLSIHLLNDTAEPVAARLTLACLKDGRTPVLTRSREVTLAPRSAEELSAFELIGAFFDVSYAYRFGPPGHDLTVATLQDAASGRVIAEAFHHPLGLAHRWPEPALSVAIERDEAGATLAIETTAYAPFVHVETEAGRPEDDWFAVVPGRPKRLRIGADGPVAGTLTLPGGRGRVGFSG